jgi:hypothetical protein
VGQQCLDLDELLGRQRRRILGLLKHAGAARSSVWNTEWEEFLTPFFRDVLATGTTVTSAARLTASMARARANLPTTSGSSHSTVTTPAPASATAPAARPARPAAGAAPAAAAPPAVRLPWVGVPCSAEIVGPRLAVWPSCPPRDACRQCPAASHASWECPITYSGRFGAPCPGFDAVGQKVPGAWTAAGGADLSTAACNAWKAYIALHRLKQSNHAPAAPAF